jgi:Membrane carboxypeptidase/penicillin-binding protein
LSASRPVPARRSPRRGTRTSPTTIGWLAIIAFCFLAGLGLIGAVATVGAYTYLASDLKDPATLTQIPLPQQSIIYDRTGKVELARFGDNQREVVTFDQIPPILVDATTAIEDKTFWDNAGFDPVAIISAAVDSFRGSSRGASTITQQLVRNRLLDPALVQDPSRTAERKLKEIIQSIRVTQAFPGEAGKQEIITAYLNQNYYGNQSYGVKSAVESYFGIALKDITPAQAAIIAALPKSPSNYDLVRNAIESCTTVVAEGDPCPKSELVVPADATVVARRNTILGLLADGRTPMSGNTYSPAELQAAANDPVLLANQAVPLWIAPHFVWAVLDELAVKLCGEGVPTCDQLAQGGLRVTTTLDLKLQKIAEKWVKAAAIVPHAKDPKAAAKALGLAYQPWMANLRNKKLRNGALVAQDYQTGEIVAYVGSADYYSRTSRPEFQPQYDVAGKGYRQPGSAFKPFNYAIAINDRTITAGTMLMDSATAFGGGYSPSDADNLERGPVRARNALQFSLNIPAVKVGVANGVDHVFAKAKEFGMGFQTDTSSAGASIALGVQEVRPVDLVSAYGALANSGKAIGHTTILTVKDSSGTDVVAPYQPPAGVQVVSPQAAWIVTDILNGNTIKSVNPFWGKFAIAGSGGRRPATLKTGTNNDAKDLSAYGYIAPPTAAGRTAGAYALVAGAWNGNSDNSLVSTARDPLFSIDVTTYVWQGFMHEATADWPNTNFKRPADGLVKVTIDPWTGLLADPGKPSVRMVHHRDRAPRPSRSRHVRHGRLRRRRDRSGPRELADRRPELDHASGEGTRDRGWPEPHADELLLQQHVQAIWILLGSAGRERIGLRRAEPVAVVLSDPDTRPERRDPVVRHPVAVGLRRDRCRPLPHAIGHAIGQPVGQSVGQPVGQSVGDPVIRTDARADTCPDTCPDACPDTCPDTCPDARTDACRDTDPSGDSHTLTGPG